MTRPLRPFWILLGMSLLLFGLLLAVEHPPQTGWGGADLDPAPVLPPTPAGSNPAGSDPAGSNPADHDPDPQPTPAQPPPAAVTERTTVWKILFPYETFSDSLRAGLVDLAVGLAEDSLAFGEQALNQLMPLTTGHPGEASLFHTLQREVWQITIVLAGVLLPLVLVVSIGSALRTGCLSVSGYASAREALLQGLLAAAGALSSHYLLSRAIDLSGLLGQAIREGIQHNLGQTIQPGHQLLRLLLGSVVYSHLPGLASVFLGFTAVLLCAGLVLGLALAFLAREVLLILAVGLAPLLLVLGALPPLRWLQSLWMKTTVLALLLGPANALLLGISVLVALHANQARLLNGESVIGFLIAAGILSVLLGLNSLLGKTVYGALLEIGHRAWQSTRAVLHLAGFAVGAGIGGPLTAGLGGASLTASGEAAASTGLGQTLGRVVSASGLPGARGLGMGIQLGSNPDYPLLQQRMRGLFTGSGPQGTFDPQQAVSDAHAGLHAENPGRTALGKSGLPAPALQQRLHAGSALVRSQFEALSALPLTPAGALADLGYTADESLQEAGTRYARAGIARYAFGARGSSPAPPTPLPRTPAPQRLSGQDLHTALDVVLQLKPNPAAASRVSPELLEQVTRSVHQRRTVGRQSLDQIRASAARVTSLDELAAWSAPAHPACDADRFSQGG